MIDLRYRRLCRAVVAGAVPVAMAVGMVSISTADPGQAGVTDSGQAGVTVPSQPAPVPSGGVGLAGFVPDPPPPSVPDRPVPRPHPAAPSAPQDTATSGDTASGDDSASSDSNSGAGDLMPGDAAPPAPRILQVGDTSVVVPDWVDPALQGKAQEWVDWVSTEIAIEYDAAGIPRDESDRRTLSTVSGGWLGAEVTGIPAGILGCVGGMAAGAVIGAGIGAAGVGAGAIPGALVGASVGCPVGAAVVGVSAVPVGVVVGAAAGAVVGAETHPGPATPPPPLSDSPVAVPAGPPEDPPDAIDMSVPGPSPAVDPVAMIVGDCTALVEGVLQVAADLATAIVSSVQQILPVPPPPAAPADPDAVATD
ncbi:hypothetical protein [Nocardia sp. alder85J]|uniref:hypothetical protein n=1 Tax=Nocardia sp. alder85J TaxID=2862949 RepID=UPI001CD313DE|nr:hypothetical protein [Nocardia sp. alder85J]MCX4093607.1 hypothetical protein [Nocardia sp. alder85J]